MWHRIWDTAASFHQRYIRPVWIRVHYNKLQEIVDDDGELEEDLLYIKNGGSGDRTHISGIGTTNHNNNLTSAQVVVHYGSINKLKNNNNNTSSYLDSLKHEEFDEVDAGFYRPFPVLETLPPNEDISDSINPIVSETKEPSSSCLKNSTVTDLKHAIIQFPSSKRPPYRLVQEEVDRIEIISMDGSSVSRTKSLNNQDSSDHKEEFQYSNKRLQQQQHHHSESPKKQNKHLNSNSNNQVEDILQTTPSLSNNVVTKKSKSRRKKAFKQMKKIAGWTWKSLKQGFYAAPYFIKPQPHTSIYSMATQYKAYFG